MKDTVISGVISSSPIAQRFPSLDLNGDVIATKGLQVPAPWMILESKCFQGRYFFFNKETKATSWTLHPSMFGLLPPVKKVEVEAKSSKEAFLGNMCVADDASTNDDSGRPSDISTDVNLRRGICRLALPSIFKTSFKKITHPASPTSEATDKKNPQVSSPMNPPMYNFCEGLGFGGFSTVVSVSHSLTGEHFAMKIIRKRTDSGTAGVKRKDHIQQLENEVRCMTGISYSPFLQQCHNCFESEKHVFFVLDLYLGGDLFHHLSQRTSSGCTFTEKEVRKLLAELYLALEHLHSQGFIHKDVKIENIMLDAQGHVKLIDFGLAVPLLPQEPSPLTLDSALFDACTCCKRWTEATSPSRTISIDGNDDSTCASKDISFSHRGLESVDEVPVVAVPVQPIKAIGSLLYMAPELLSERTGGRHTDWWAYGVLAHELFCGHSPWSSLTNNKVLKYEILNKEFMFPSYLSPNAAAFLNSLLCRDVNLRLGSREDSEIMKCPFFKNVDWIETASLRAKPAFNPGKVQMDKDDRKQAQADYETAIFEAKQSALNQREQQADATTLDTAKGFPSKAIKRGSSPSSSDEHSSDKFWRLGVEDFSKYYI